MNSPVVSILMPVRNDAVTLVECIESIQTQTMKNWELIAVDDGSTDDSVKVLNEASRSDPRIRIITTEARGIVPALNTGISACEGQFISRMDADDRMLPERLDFQMEYLNFNKDIHICGCRVKPFTSEGPVSENVKKYHNWSNHLLTHEEIQRDLFVESPIMHPTFFAYRKLFEFLGGYLEQPWAEDYDFLLRASAAKYRFGKCPEILMEKRHGDLRLSKVDPIYKRPAMIRAKVHYFLASEILEDFNGILIFGSGPTGRELARVFLKRKVPLAGFIDNRSGPPQRTVLGYPAWGFPDGIKADFLVHFKDRMIVLGIGESTAQTETTKLLIENGRIENKNFIRMA